MDMPIRMRGCGIYVFIADAVRMHRLRHGGRSPQLITLHPWCWMTLLMDRQFAGHVMRHAHLSPDEPLNFHGVPITEGTVHSPYAEMVTDSGQRQLM